MLTSRILLTATALVLALATSGCAGKAHNRHHHPQQPAPHTAGAHAQAAGWAPLGRRDVAFGGDHDTIMVTAADGRFRALRLHVSGSPLEMARVKVTFGNGQTFEPAVRHVFRQGAWTRRIDLPGKKRVVRKVEFWYRSMGKKSGRATVQLAGY